MKVIVCIKQVPDVADVHFDPVTRRIIRDGVRLITNPFDRPGIALAVDLKQRFGAQTTVVTMGPPQAQEALYEALASGIDRAVHLSDRAFAGADTLATARTLAALIRREGFDVVVCGKHTVDGETAQVGPEIAELLDIPHVAGAAKIRWSDDGTRLFAERESDDGHEEVELPLPCLVTVAEHLLPPIGVRKPALESARQQPIETVGASDLGLSPEQVGAAGSPTWVAEIRPAPAISRPPIQMLSGSTPEVAHALAEHIARLLAERPRAEPLRLPPPRSAPGSRAIWVVIERHAGGELAEGTCELLGHAAIALAGPLGGEVIAVHLGPADDALADACAAEGADRVLMLEHPALVGHYNNEAFSAAIAHAIEARQPEIVLFSSTERGRDFAPRVAARLGLGLTGDAIALEIDEKGKLVQIKPAFGGHVVAPVLSRTMPQMATVRPGVLPRCQSSPERQAPSEVLPIATLPSVRATVTPHPARQPARVTGLAGARVVVGVGYGIGDPANIPLCEALAEVLSGSIAATRRVTDKGWLPRSIQVGLTGKAIAPDLYIAVGIRGLPNHMIGIQRAGAIVAMNKDPKAPIFEIASVGVVADALELLPVLTDALRERPR